MKTPILEAVYEFLLGRDVSKNDFITRNDSLEKQANRIMGYVPEDKRLKVNSMVGNYGYEQFCCGYISGFRSAMNILQELGSYRDDDFLIGILPDREDEE